VHRAALLVCLSATAAHAQGRIALDEDQLAVDVTAEINLAHNYIGEPLSLAPDARWGATNRLTIGLTHSRASVDRFEPGGSLCLTTDPLYCDSTYRGSTLDARYLVADGAVQVAPRVRALLVDVAPVATAFSFGALVRWQRGRVAIVSDPYVQLGVAGVSKGNRSGVVIPVELAVALARVELALHSGWNTDFAVIEDGWHIPIAIGGRVAITRAVAVGATLGFASLLGPQNTPKQRVLFVSVGWRR
jgi:hypothetical protein